MSKRTEQPAQELEMLTFSVMDKAVNGSKGMSRHIFFNNELGIIQNDPSVFRSLMYRGKPYSINDFRMGSILQGELHAVINLEERHLKAGTMAFIGPGTIAQPLAVSDDFRIKGMVVFPDFPMPFSDSRMPEAFNGQRTHFFLTPNADNLAVGERLLDTLWQVAKNHYDRPTLSGLVAAIMNHWNRLYLQADSDNRLHSAPKSRERDLLDRFIRLVNKHATSEHQIAYYADRLCLTERYLGTVIRQTSGTTAKEWIDRALITHIKVELRHTDKSIAQVSDEMHFSNPSFFNKYFKRMTGMTPLEYKRQ